MGALSPLSIGFVQVARMSLCADNKQAVARFRIFDHRGAAGGSTVIKDRKSLSASRIMMNHAYPHPAQGVQVMLSLGAEL